MALQRFLIAPYQSGLDDEIEPWLLPQDAFTELNNGYIYRGALQNRQGFSQFAVGGRGAVEQCDSRIIDASTAIDGAPITTDGAGATSFTLTNEPIRENDLVITVGLETITDDGLGILTGTIAATGTVNYVTGAVAIAGATPATAVTVTYNYFPGVAVTGLATYITATNQNNELIAWDTSRVNRYNTATNRLDLITGATLSGGATDLVSWKNSTSLTHNLAASTAITAATQANPCQITSGTHGLNTGDKVIIASVGGMTELNINQQYTITSVDANNVTLDGIDARRFTLYTAGGTIARVTGNIPDRPVLVFVNGVDPVQVYDGTSIADYSLEDGYREPNADRGGSLDTAVHIVNYAGRLLFLRPTQGGTVYPQRVLYTGTGPNRNDFSSFDSGFIEADTNEWLQAYAFYKSELVVFFEESTWVLKITGQASAPFRFVQIDESRNTKAPFGAISYLNRTTSIGPLGLIATDGYEVARIDNKIPRFTTEEINQSRFNQVYAGRWDINRQHIYLYPEREQSDNTAALAANYEENTFSKYTFQMNVLGRFREYFDTIWDDLINPWETYSLAWDSFSGEIDAFFMAGGDAKGFVYRFTEDDYDDANFRITGVTLASPGVISTTPNTLADGDVVRIDGIAGTTELNNGHYIVDSAASTSIQLRYITGVLVDTTAMTAYTSGGIVQKAINFSASTKLLNPFIEDDRKARLAYIDIYITADGSSTADVELYTSDRPDPYKTAAIDFTEPTAKEKKWVRVTANQTADFHKVRIKQYRADEPIKIHGMVLAMEPAGPLTRVV
jgi:hypothetical protein